MLLLPNDIRRLESRKPECFKKAAGCTLHLCISWQAADRRGKPGEGIGLEHREGAPQKCHQSMESQRDLPAGSNVMICMEATGSKHSSASCAPARVDEQRMHRGLCCNSEEARGIKRARITCV